MTKRADSEQFDRRSVLEDARRWAQQGKLPRAIEAYEQVVAHDPTDWASANALGDLLVRARRADRAMAEFMRIGDHMADSGFLARASGFYSKILRLDPTQTEARRRVDALNARRFAKNGDEGAPSPRAESEGAEARAGEPHVSDTQTSTDRPAPVQFEIEPTSRSAPCHVIVGEGAAETDVRAAASAPMAGPDAVDRTGAWGAAAEAEATTDDAEDLSGWLDRNELGDVEGRHASLAGEAEVEAVSADWSLERGIQLAEEGRWQEAEALLAEAATAPHLRHEAARHLARVRLNDGAPAEALEWLDWAAQEPAPSPTVAWALGYDMAVALEAAGRPQVSLAVLREIRAEAGAGYQDVDARIGRLLDCSLRPSP